MMKNRERVERSGDEDSGVHLTLRGGWGTYGEELVRRLTAELGARVLRRFTRLSETDSSLILKRAAARLLQRGAPLRGPIDAHVRRAVYVEATTIDLARFIRATCAEPDDVKQRLDLARRRLSLLTSRERSVLRAVFTLDAVAEDDEAGKVVLHAAVAYQMRWNTAHQNVSRAWRKICDRGLAAWEIDWRAAHRFVCEPPSAELWTAARTYLDACSGRGEHGGHAFTEWTEAHERHNTAFADWKRSSNVATQAWRAFAETLDRSPVRPGEVADPLLARCRELGIDRSLVPARLAQQTWGELLARLARLAAEARDAWRAFVWTHPFGADVEIAFCELGVEAARADALGADLARAYDRLLMAAERRSIESVRAKEELRCLLEAARWT